MAADSKIEWTDHTFNPWWGCTKVSPACDHCYAETWAKRTGHAVWGAKTERRHLSDSHWRQPGRWDAAAQQAGTRARVFCASMGDVFEWGASLSKLRARLWDLIERTPNLDWLLLTKRPHLVTRLAPWRDDWPDNVWLGTTAETQRFLDQRARHLREIPARIRFLSCEPLLGELRLDEFREHLDWVIAGGESGGGSRPTNPDWFRSIRDQCQAFDIAFHFKQWGDWAPISGASGLPVRVGKPNAGRVLDGREWNEGPHAGSQAVTRLGLP